MPATPKASMRTRKQDIARKMREQAALRRQCVTTVWTRARGHCEECGRRVELPQVASSVLTAGHVHETTPRSRGGDATDPAQCVLLCRGCHFSGPSGAHRGRQG
jgi:5-methylcytosine-specific restriction endonuclease McrA